MTPDKCLKYEQTGRYCWPGDALCKNCQMILDRAVDRLEAAVNRSVMDRVFAMLRGK